MSVSLEILLFVLSLAGVLVSLIGVPGNFVPVLAVLTAVLTGAEGLGWGWFAVFLLIAVSGEVVDQLTGIFGAKKSGASRAGMLGAVIGAFAGGMLGTALVPVIGTLIGVFAGCFILTFVFEYYFSGKNTEESARAGFGALAGKVIATAYKFAIGFIMLVLLIWRFWLV